jgi:aminoglycoside phosphotransferase (APT) family kinase protein
LRLNSVLQQFADSGHGSRDLVREIEQLISDLESFALRSGGSNCFVHNDLHESNILCSPRGELLALIDWGDAGWGDATLDFAAIPLDSISAALAGYDRMDRLGDYPEARFVWDHLNNALDDAIDDPTCKVPVNEFRQLLAAPHQ